MVLQGSEAEEACEEATTLVDLLQDRHQAVTNVLDGHFPELRSTVWQSEASVQSAVQVCIFDKIGVLMYLRIRIWLKDSCFERRRSLHALK